MLLKKAFHRIRSEFFPTEHQLMLKKWWADGGDYELRFNYDLTKESIVLDLGGYKGQWASDIFSRYRCHIFVFEPVRMFAEQIRYRFSRNDQIEVFQYGLGGSTRKEIICICADGSSVFRSSSNCEEIIIIDVKDWMGERNVYQIDLAKINIEGGEYELLERLIETNLIERIKDIQVQFHDISDNSRRLMEQIQKKLRKTHKPTYQYEFVWENWTRT